jgi:hypothetical protein
MHVLPLPFGMALALLPQRDARRLSKPKAVFLPPRESTVRERIRTESRYAEIRQRVI